MREVGVDYVGRTMRQMCKRVLRDKFGAAVERVVGLVDGGDVAVW